MYVYIFFDILDLQIQRAIAGWFPLKSARVCDRTCYYHQHYWYCFSYHELWALSWGQTCLSANQLKLLALESSLCRHRSTHKPKAPHTATLPQVWAETAQQLPFRLPCVLDGLAAEGKEGPEAGRQVQPWDGRHHLGRADTEDLNAAFTEVCVVGVAHQNLTTVPPTGFHNSKGLLCGWFSQDLTTAQSSRGRNFRPTLEVSAQQMQHGRRRKLECSYKPHRPWRSRRRLRAPIILASRPGYELSERGSKLGEQPLQKADW